MYKLFFVLLIVVNSVSASQVYKCTVDGKESYSQMPCAEEEKQERLYELEKVQPAHSRPSRTTSEFSVGIKVFCTNKWDDDYSMRKYCIEQQNEAMGKVSKYVRANIADIGDGTPPSKIFTMCFNKWTKAINKINITDFSMLDYCIQQQQSAFDSL